jgi:hypothetical protein
VFGGLDIAAVAQVTSDRGAMITGVPQDPQQMYGVYQQLSSALTQAHDNCYITAWVCAGAVLLAARMRSRRRAAGGESVVVEV